jgi:Velvet factor
MAFAALEIVVQPPAVAQVGAVLEPPLALTMSTTTTVNGHGGNPGRIWASVTLLTEYGSVVSDSLSGSLADSVHSFANRDDSAGYFLFDNLVIESVGSFRIKVTLMHMDNSGNSATSVDQVETDVIVVEDAEVEQQAPSMMTL